jgi:hypothetical protein
METIREIVFDCASAPTLARFWAAVLDRYAVRPYDRAEIDRLAKLGLAPETDSTVLVDGLAPMLSFQQVPECRYEANRVHLDISVADRGTKFDESGSSAVKSFGKRRTIRRTMPG